MKLSPASSASEKSASQGVSSMPSRVFIERRPSPAQSPIAQLPDFLL
jgi:hypothetical protein